MHDLNALYASAGEKIRSVWETIWNRNHLSIWKMILTNFTWNLSFLRICSIFLESIKHWIRLIRLSTFFLMRPKSLSLTNWQQHCQYLSAFANIFFNKATTITLGKWYIRQNLFVADLIGYLLWIINCKYFPNWLVYCLLVLYRPNKATRNMQVLCELLLFFPPLECK